MGQPDGGAAILAVLGDYFSTPIARALLAATLRREKLDTAPLAISDAIHALERSLPMYLADAGRKGECIARLRGLAPKARPPAAPPPALVTASTVVHIGTTDDVMSACEVGRDTARRVGFPPVAQTKIATAIAELARNVLLYARTGDVRIAALQAPRPGVDVLVTDQGPGIKDLGLVMTGPYRSKTGMGMGLRGAKRLMDDFDVATSALGTTVVARKFLT